MASGELLSPAEIDKTAAEATKGTLSETQIATRIEGPASGDPALASIDELLYDAVAASDSELEAVLASCEDPARREAVRRLLARENDAAQLLETPRLTQIATATVTDPNRRKRRLASFLSGELGVARWRLLRFASGARTATLAIFALFVVMHWQHLAFEAPIMLEVGSLFAVVALSWILRWAAGSRHLGDAAVVALGVAFALVSSALLGSLHAFHQMHVYGVATGFGAPIGALIS